MVIKVRVSPPNSFQGEQLANSVPMANHGRAYRYSTYMQSVDTRGHPYFLLGKVRRNIGGHFISKRYDVELGSTRPWVAVQKDSAGREMYRTKTIVLPSTPLANRLMNMATLTSSSTMKSTLNSIVPSPMPEAQLVALGTKAVSMFQPLNPVADTSTTIAEFISERKLFNVPGTSGSLPGEYLNYMFGISPSVGYVQDLRYAIQNREKILEQLARDSGRWIRRRGTVLDDSETVNQDHSYQEAPGTIGPSLNSYLARNGKLRTTTRTSTKVWFSGAFTYHLPKEGTMWRTVAELDKLYGVKLNVDTAWELLPFSWLVDYKFSAGAALSNLSAFSADGLVMPYGYIMCTTRRETEYTWTGSLRDENGAWKDEILYARDTSVTKQRLPANPFGFGLLPGDLTDRQWSILAALGMSYLT